MRRPSTWWLLVVLVLVVGGCQGALEQGLSTAANKSEDVYIVYKGMYFKDTTSLLPDKVVEEVVYDLQEGTHEKITDVTGAEVDHYYIWVCLNKFCIPVDPFSYSR